MYIHEKSSIVIGNEECSFKKKWRYVIDLKIFIELHGLKRIGLYSDNNLEWILVDLACLWAKVTLIPIPLYFSTSQIRHIVEVSEMDALLEVGDSVCETVRPIHVIHFKETIRCKIIRRGAFDESAIRKITFTSGSTGTPKGVLLTEESMINVARSVANAISMDSEDIHLCVLPLSVLLENVAGVYSSLYAGAKIVILPLDEMGFSGSSMIDAEKLFYALSKYSITTAITTPQILTELIEYIDKNSLGLPALRMLGVGGGVVSKRILQKSLSLSIPVYEGYGLSEVGSVACLNFPGNNRLGSVGKPLPHVDVFIEGDEIKIRKNLFSGYLEEDYFDSEGICSTGDLGCFDSDGYLYIRGRKKNIIVSSYGRNISPEWVESELLFCEEIKQVCVFGEGKPYLVALIYSPECEDIESVLKRVNTSLPDYARIRDYLLVKNEFSVVNKQLTGNMKIRRDVIYGSYQNEIEALYSRNPKKNL